MLRARWLARLIKKAVANKILTKPDFVIGGNDQPYMLRWWIIPRNRFFNVYLHRIIRSDDDRALHDHPWVSLSFILDGEMWEVLPVAPNVISGRLLKQGNIVTRTASSAHRLELRNSQPCMTLFLTGPRVREWGFHCPRGWRHWKEFTAVGDTGSIGRGCE